MEADHTMSTSAWDLLEQAYEEARHFYFYNVAADLFIIKAPRNDVVGSMYTIKIRPPQFTALAA